MNTNDDQDHNLSPSSPSSLSNPVKRVAYIWSRELQDVCDDLPSNIGRSSMVHSLIGAFDLLDMTPASANSASDQDEEEDIGEQIVVQPDTHDADTLDDQSHTSAARARVIPPDLALGQKAYLLKYHEAAYVDYLLKDRSDDFDQNGENANDSEESEDEQSEVSSPSSSSSSSSTPDDRPAKRRRRFQQTPPPSKRSHGLTHDNPPFPTMAEYAKQVTAATSTACRLLTLPPPRGYDISICWDGGRHHAKRAEASGFCYVADIVLGCMLLVREGRVVVDDEAKNEDLQELSGGIIAGRGDRSTPTSTAQTPTLADGRINGDETSQEDNIPNANGTTNDDDRSNPPSQLLPLPPIPSQPRTRKRPRTRAPRIMYLDMDLHYGDGVASAFHSPTHYPYPLPLPLEGKGKGKGKIRAPSVLTLSIHHSSPIFFPPPNHNLSSDSDFSQLPAGDTPHPFTLSLPLRAYPSSATYSQYFERCIEPIYKAYDPDYVVVQLGVDGLPGDRIGQFGNWSIHNLGGVIWLLERVKRWDKKLCVLGGGGYDHSNTARAWASATSVLLDRSGELSEDTHIPHHENYTEYSPSFTMDISQGHMRDENTPEEIDHAAKVYQVVAQRIKEIVENSS